MSVFGRPQADVGPPSSAPKLPSSKFHNDVCYWLLFVSLFPLGMTNAAMAAVTLVIFAEKTLRRPEFASYGAAVVLMLCGLLMAVAPGLPAVFGFFGRLSEDVWFRLGLVAWIMVLFIAANATRPKR